MPRTCFEAAAMAYQVRAEPDVAETRRLLIGNSTAHANQVVDEMMHNC
jgi:hypothetical protein